MGCSVERYRSQKRLGGRQKVLQVGCVKQKQESNPEWKYVTGTDGYPIGLKCTDGSKMIIPKPLFSSELVEKNFIPDVNVIDTETMLTPLLMAVYVYSLHRFTSARQKNLSLDFSIEENLLQKYI